MYIHKRVINADRFDVTTTLVGTPGENSNKNLYKLFEEQSISTISSIIDKNTCLRTHHHSILDAVQIDEVKLLTLKALIIGYNQENCIVTQMLVNLLEKMDLYIDFLPNNTYEYVCVHDNAFAYLALRVTEKSSDFEMKYNVIQPTIRRGTF